MTEVIDEMFAEKPINEIILRKYPNGVKYLSVEMEDKSKNIKMANPHNSQILLLMGLIKIIFLRSK